MNINISKSKFILLISIPFFILLAFFSFSPSNASAANLFEIGVGEEFQQEQLTQEEIDELITVDNTKELETFAVMNINSFIRSGYRTTFSTRVHKVSGTTVSWNINWTSVGSARIGVIGANGTFYYLSDSGGSSIRTARIPLSQNYQFAISNTSAVDSNFAGWRDL